MLLKCQWKWKNNFHSAVLRFLNWTLVHRLRYEITSCFHDNSCVVHALSTFLIAMCVQSSRCEKYSVFTQSIHYFHERKFWRRSFSMTGTFSQSRSTRLMWCQRLQSSNIWSWRRWNLARIWRLFLLGNWHQSGCIRCRTKLPSTCRGKPAHRSSKQ